MDRRAFIYFLVLLLVVMGLLTSTCRKLDRCREELAATCPGFPEEPVDSCPDILLEPDAAVWQTIDNHFTHVHDGTSFQDRSGILFQFGLFIAPSEDPAPGEIPYSTRASLGEVEISYLDSNGQPASVTVSTEPPTSSSAPKKFTWINVFPRMDAGIAEAFSEWVHALYPAEGSDEPCGPRLGRPADVLNEPCRRNRSLRASFLPQAIMTFWSGEGGYDTHSEYTPPDPEGNRGMRSRFVLKEKMEVMVWDGVKTVYRLSNVFRIHLKAAGGADHGEIHQPPIGTFQPGSGGISPNWEPFP